MCLQSFPNPLMSAALRPIYSQGDICECIFNNHPLVIREGMYVSVMCCWTCVLVCFLVFSFTLSPSLFLVIVFLLDNAISDSLHRKYSQSFPASPLSQDIGVVGKGREQQRMREDRRRGGGGQSFFHLQGRCFSKSAWGYTPAPQLPEAFPLPPNSQPPSVSHGQMMGRFPLLCPALFSLPIFFSECTSTQVRMAELPGNSQKPLVFGTICPGALLLLLIRKKWGWMQSTSSPLNVMRLCKLVLLSSFLFSLF